MQVFCNQNLHNTLSESFSSWAGGPLGPCRRDRGKRVNSSGGTAGDTRTRHTAGTCAPPWYTPRHGEESCDRASPPDAAGESYRASDAAVGQAHHTGKVWTAARSPDRTRSPDRSDRISRSQSPCGPEPTGFSPARMRVQLRNRMREHGTSGTARGVPGNRPSYRGGAERTGNTPRTGEVSYDRRSGRNLLMWML